MAEYIRTHLHHVLVACHTQQHHVRRYHLDELRILVVKIWHLAAAGETVVRSQSCISEYAHRKM